MCQQMVFTLNFFLYVTQDELMLNTKKWSLLTRWNEHNTLDKKEERHSLFLHFVAINV